MRGKNPTGDTVRQLCEARKMSTVELAEQSRSNPEFIRRVEEGKLVVLLAPLSKIARAIGVRPGTFLDDVPRNGPVIVREDRPKKVVRFFSKIFNCRLHSILKSRFLNLSA